MDNENVTSNMSISCKDAPFHKDSNFFLNSINNFFVDGWFQVSTQRLHVSNKDILSYITPIKSILNYT